MGTSYQFLFVCLPFKILWTLTIFKLSQNLKLPKKIKCLLEKYFENQMIYFKKKTSETDINSLFYYIEHQEMWIPEI